MRALEIREEAFERGSLSLEVELARRCVRNMLSDCWYFGSFMGKCSNILS